MLGCIRDGFLRLYMKTPEHPMKYRFVRWLGQNVFPLRGVQKVVYPDLRLWLHPRDWIEYLLLRGDKYEPLTLDFLMANLHTGDYAALAGVNFGQHVAVAARAVGPTGRVLGVEPQPRALAKAWDNLQLNRLSGCVTMVSSALGSRNEMVTMAWSDQGNAGAASLLDEGSGLTVHVTPLPRILQAVGINQVRMFLLDVQGFEAHVIQGMEGGPLPEIIVVEVDDLFVERAGTTPVQLLHQIKGLGYELFSIDGRPVVPENAELPERNVVGLRPGVTAVWSRLPT